MDEQFWENCVDKLKTSSEDAAQKRSAIVNLVAKGVSTNEADNKFSINLDNLHALNTTLAEAGFTINKDIVKDLSESIKSSQPIALTERQLKLLFLPKYVQSHVEKSVTYYLPTDSATFFANTKKVEYSSTGHTAHPLPPDELTNQKVFGQNFWQECVNTLIQQASTTHSLPKVESTVVQGESEIIPKQNFKIRLENYDVLKDELKKQGFFPNPDINIKDRDTFSEDEIKLLFMPKYLPIPQGGIIGYTEYQQVLSAKVQENQVKYECSSETAQLSAQERIIQAEFTSNHLLHYWERRANELIENAKKPKEE